MGTPLYQKIADQLEPRIHGAPESTLPSIEFLAHEFGVSYPTMWKAFRVLAEKGAIEVHRGRRSTPRSQRAQSPSNTSVDRIRGIFQQLIADGTWKVDKPLPKMAWISSEYSASPQTIRIALESLAAQGWVTRKGRRWICGTARAQTRARKLSSPIVIMVVAAVERLDYVFASPFLARFVESLRDEFTAAGMGLRIAGFYGPAGTSLVPVPVGMEAVRDQIRQLGPDYAGTIIAATKLSIPTIEGHAAVLLPLGKPVVFLDSTDEAHELFLAPQTRPEDFYRLYLNEESAVRQALAALTSAGHRTIGIHAWEYSDWSARRTELLTKIAATLPSPPRIVRSRLPLEPGWGYTSTDGMGGLFNDLHAMFAASPTSDTKSASLRRELLAKTASLWRMLVDDEPTALIALNDDFAQQIYLWCQALNIRIPADLSIVSFDNTTRSILFPLSTIDFGFSSLGYIAAHLCIGDTPPPKTDASGAIGGPCTLVDRGSIGAPGDVRRRSRILTTTLA